MTYNNFRVVGGINEFVSGGLKIAAARSLTFFPLNGEVFLPLLLILGWSIMALANKAGKK